MVHMRLCVCGEHHTNQPRRQDCGLPCQPCWYLYSSQAHKVDMYSTLARPQTAVHQAVLSSGVSTIAVSQEDTILDCHVSLAATYVAVTRASLTHTVFSYIHALCKSCIATHPISHAKCRMGHTCSLPDDMASSLSCLHLPSESAVSAISRAVSSLPSCTASSNL